MTHNISATMLLMSMMLVFIIFISKMVNCLPTTKIYIAESGSLVRLRCDLPHSSSISNPAITTSQLWHGETNRVTWRKLTSRDDDEEDDENSLYNDKMTRKGWQEKINAKRATSTASSSSDHSQEENLTPFANNGRELEIKSAKASDSGLWQCVNNTLPSAGADAKILDQARIFVIPRFASGPFLFQLEDGAILSNSSVITAKEGYPLALICVSRQMDRLDFSLNDHEIRGHKVLTYLVGPDKQTSVAYKVWNKTAEKIMKNATCGTTVVKINVHYPPSFTLKREPQFGIPIIEGMTVMLGCDVDSNPPINATGWLKNEQILPNNNNDIIDTTKQIPSEKTQNYHQTLVLPDVGIQDVGWYQCTTKYSGESISSIGYFLNIHHIASSSSTSSGGGRGTSNHLVDDEESEVMIQEEEEESLLPTSSLEASFGNSNGILLHNTKDRSLTVAAESVVTSPEKLSGQQPSGSDLQKSIQIATNVLSFSNKNEKCEGCCDPQNEFHPGGSPMYGQPEIHLVNGTSKVMFLKQTKSMRNLTAQICGNPPVDRIIVEIPNGELLKPGQQSSDKIFRLQSWERPFLSNVAASSSRSSNSKASKPRPLCKDIQLFAQNIGSSLLPGKYTILAKNRFGFAEITLQVQFKASKAEEIISVSGGGGEAAMSSKCDSIFTKKVSKSLITSFILLLFKLTVS